MDHDHSLPVGLKFKVITLFKVIKLNEMSTNLRLMVVVR